jgi:hypothetical protein
MLPFNICCIETFLIHYKIYLNNKNMKMNYINIVKLDRLYG